MSVTAYIDYPMDLIEEGSVVNLFISLVGNVFGFNAVRVLRLKGLRLPLAYVLTCNGLPYGIHIRVLAKALHLYGSDYLHFGAVVGKLEGDRVVIVKTVLPLTREATT